MKIAFFDTHSFERTHFESLNGQFGHDISFFEPRLTDSTARLATGHPAVCCFANDKLDERALRVLKQEGVRLIALRSAGFNHVDLKVAGDLGLKVVRVPAYSPYSVAEHAAALILSLNRRIHRAYQRVREGNFSLDGLVGFDLHGKTVGVLGTGRIGSAFVKIMLGFGCRVIAHDPSPDKELAKSIEYVALDSLYEQSDIVSLHLPLTPSTRHLIDESALSKMKKGVMLINTGRGKLIETAALVKSLKNGHVGFAGLDVYEEEEGIFFADLSNEVLQDDQLARLLTFPNVLVTSHQGFLTEEALTSIARTTLQNVSDFEQGRPLENEVR
jgi:D-lactate dehydrogenase